MTNDYYQENTYCTKCGKKIPNTLPISSNNLYYDTDYCQGHGDEPYPMNRKQRRDKKHNRDIWKKKQRRN